MKNEIKNIIKTLLFDGSTINTVTAYQELKKHMTPNEANILLDIIVKGRKPDPIGTVHNGRKKMPDGKWLPVKEGGSKEKEPEEQKKDSGENDVKEQIESLKTRDKLFVEQIKEAKGLREQSEVLISYQKDLDSSLKKIEESQEVLEKKDLSKESPEQSKNIKNDLSLIYNVKQTYSERLKTVENKQIQVELKSQGASFTFVPKDENGGYFHSLHKHFDAEAESASGGIIKLYETHYPKGPFLKPGQKDQMVSALVEKYNKPDFNGMAPGFREIE